MTPIDVALLDLKVLWAMEAEMEALDTSYYEYELPIGLIRNVK